MLLTAVGRGLGAAAAASGAVAAVARRLDKPVALVADAGAARWHADDRRVFWHLLTGPASEGASESAGRVEGRAAGAPAGIDPAFDPGPFEMEADSVLRFERRAAGARAAGAHRRVALVPSERALFARVLSARPAAVLDFARRPALALPPSRLLGGLDLFLRRRRGEPLAGALARLAERLRAPGAEAPDLSPVPPPCRSGAAAAAAEALPGGRARPWVVFAPAPDDGALPPPPDLWRALAGRLLGGALPGARAAVLGAPGEEALGAAFAEMLRAAPLDAHARDLTGRVGPARATALFARARLVVCANRTAAQMSAAARAPTLLLAPPSPPPDEALPLWPGQSALASDASASALDAALAPLLAPSPPRAPSRPESP